MQIVCVTHAYPRDDKDIAGAFIERLVLALKDRSHSIKVIAPSDSGTGRRDRRHGISVSRVRYAPAGSENLAYRGTMAERSASPAGALWAASLMVAEAREIAHLHSVAAVDIVHAHWWVPGGVAAWLARLVGKPPYVVTLHGTDVRVLEQSWAGRMVAKRVLRRAAAVTAVSSYLAEQAAEFAGIDVGQIIVQPMPVDTARFTRVSHGGGGIVSVGRLTKQKNLGVVFEAIARLKTIGKPIPLTVIGDGPFRGMLEQRVKGLGIHDVVTFLGHVPPDKVPDAIGDADVMVFPAVREGLGLVAAEALMLGVPVIATKAGGGVTDIVPPTGAGRLIPADDPIALTKAITGFLEDPASRRLAQDAGASLRRRLSPDAVAKVFETVYRDAVGGRTGDEE
jgi:glycosyltransferase involved in cell wall biosynthesis